MVLLICISFTEILLANLMTKLCLTHAAYFFHVPDSLRSIVCTIFLRFLGLFSTFLITFFTLFYYSVPKMVNYCLSCFYARKQLLLSACLSHRNSVCLSVRLSVTRVDQSKAVHAKIT